MTIKRALNQVSNATWVIIIVAIVFTMLFWWFVTTFNKVPYEQHLGYSTEARRNPYLAAELFLKERSITLETRHDFNLFEETPGQFDTIFISGSRIGMASSHREKMRQWIQQGGHLVLLATEFYEYDFNASRDKFLDDFGLRFYPVSDGDYEFDYDDYEDADSESNQRDDLARLKFAGFEQETKVEFYPDGYLEDTSGDATFTAGSVTSDQLIQYSLGDGLLTVIVDFSIWNNYRIDEQDHAMLLTQLIGNSPRAWLVYNRLQPSLLSLMLTHLPLVLVSAVSLFGLLLLGALWRKGPARDDTPPIQREIMQHIAAAGEFAFRVDNGYQLILTLRHGLEQRLKQLIPGYHRLSADKQLIKLSHMTGLPSERLQLLWQTGGMADKAGPENSAVDSGDSHTNEPSVRSPDLGKINQDTFVATVQLIQEIRKHL